MNNNTQLTKALEALSKMRGAANLASRYVNDLETIVDLAQNEPPDGKSDSSISEPVWIKLRDICKAHNVLLATIEKVIPK